MFNLKCHKNIDDSELIRLELEAFNIRQHPNGYCLRVGDEDIVLPTLQSCISTIDSAIKELIEHAWDSWKDLTTLGQRIMKGGGSNSGSIDNLIFLNSIRKLYVLCDRFTDLQKHKHTIEHLLDSDIESADDHLIRHFNQEYITIQSLHHLIMDELYRKQLIKKFMIMTKQAQISGPWANLDLPMGERMWEWDSGEEEYFDNRAKSRRSQVRYNPEDATSNGFFYVWQDLRRDPYRFEDREEEGVYPSRHTLSIP